MNTYAVYRFITKLISKLKIMVVLMLSLSCSNIALADQSWQPTQEELKNAEQLFQKNNIALDETKDETLKIIRYRKDDLGNITVVCSQFYRSLPVIHGDIGFHFDKSGKVSDYITGIRINKNYEFPVELVPTISEFEALRIEISSRDYPPFNKGRVPPQKNRNWTSSRNNQQSDKETNIVLINEEGYRAFIDEEVNRVWNIYKDPNYKGSKIVLGIYNKNSGSDLKPIYVLVWSVGGFIIDAQSGKIHHYPGPIWIN